MVDHVFVLLASRGIFGKMPTPTLGDIASDSVRLASVFQIERRGLVLRRIVASLQFVTETILVS